MSNFRSYVVAISPVTLCSFVVAILAVAYIGLLAVVMNYAALTVEFSQSVRDEESVVAALEGQYLAEVARITTTDYTSDGYAVPLKKVFVRMSGATALR